MQILIKHSDNLGDIVIPLHKATYLPTEFIPLLLVQIAIIAVRDR